MSVRGRLCSTTKVGISGDTMVGVVSCQEKFLKISFKDIYRLQTDRFKALYCSKPYSEFFLWQASLTRHPQIGIRIKLTVWLKCLVRESWKMPLPTALSGKPASHQRSLSSGRSTQAPARADVQGQRRKAEFADDHLAFVFYYSPPRVHWLGTVSVPNSPLRTPG